MNGRPGASCNGPRSLVDKDREPGRAPGCGGPEAVGAAEREDEGLSALVDHRSDPGDSSSEDAPAADPADASADVAGDGEAERAEPLPADGAAGETAVVEQETVVVTARRADFGAHFEAHYPRLVAQLYAITLDAAEAHDSVQDAYARAWKKWQTITAEEDPVDWVRRVAVSSTTRSWRSLLAGAGLKRPAPPDTSMLEPRTATLIRALHQLSPPERRAVVLHHMAGLSIRQIAAVERATPRRVQERVYQARLLLARALATISWPSVERAVPVYDPARYAIADDADWAPFGDLADVLADDPADGSSVGMRDGRADEGGRDGADDVDRPGDDGSRPGGHGKDEPGDDARD